MSRKGNIKFIGLALVFGTILYVAFIGAVVKPHKPQKTNTTINTEAEDTIKPNPFSKVYKKAKTDRERKKAEILSN